MFPFRRLRVWRLAHALAVYVHKVTRRPSRERSPYLVNQLRRVSGSIGANIAEGSGHDSAARFARYLTTALASARELDQHAILARYTGLLRSDEYKVIEESLDEICAKLVLLRRRVFDNGRDRP